MRKSAKSIIESSEVQMDKEAYIVPSGSKLINLMTTDSYQSAFSLGRYIQISGDSSTGKSFFVLSMLAEIANNPAFDKYELVYDDTEHACSFDIKKLFGSKLASRLTMSSISSTVEEFTASIYNRVQSGVPFIYILDSFDALSSEEERENVRKEAKSGETVTTMGQERAKKMSKFFRALTCELSKTNSFLVIVSQLRDNIGAGLYAPKKKTVGGESLKFYASARYELSKKSDIKKEIGGKEYIIGVQTKVKCTKNKFEGKVREAVVDIYYDYGIDDIGSCLNYAKEYDFCSVSRGVFDISELGLSGDSKTIIEKIENEGLQDKLYAWMEAKWREREDKLSLNRKGKFE